MILYVDTSALVKLFVDEQHAEQVRQWVAGATQLVVSELTWVEMCAALALKMRTRQVDAPQVRSALAALRKGWPSYQRLGTDAALFAEAGELALRHDLRAYDSVQLASARRAFGTTGAALVFCCFDRQLNAAATAIGLPVFSAG